MHHMPAALLVLLLATACAGEDDTASSEPLPADAGQDDGGPQAPTGPDWPELPPDGLLRRVDDWVREPAGHVADRGPGDLVLEGEGGAFAIQGFHGPVGWGTGFSVVDAWLKTATGERPDFLLEWFPVVGTSRLYQRGLVLQEVESIDAGGPGQAAEIVLRLGMRGIQLLDALTATAQPHFPLEVRLRLRFAPAGRELVMITEATNVGHEPFQADLGDGVLWGDRVQLFAQGEGEAVTDSYGAALPWLAAWSPGQVAMGYAARGEELTVILYDEVSILIAPSATLAPGETTTYERSFLLEEGDLDALIGRLRGVTGEELPVRRVHGKVDGDAAGAVVRVDTIAGYAATRTVVGEDGTWAVHVPPGRHNVTVRHADGRVAGPTEVEVAGADLEVPDLALPAWGTLRVKTVVTGTDTAVPAKLQVHSVAGADPISRAPRTVWSPGEVALPHPAGPVTVVASRGFEYALATGEVHVNADAPVTLTLTLDPIAPDRTWISGDFHVHTEVSPDSAALVKDRVVEYAAEGVDLLVATDHDVATDLSAVIVAAGLDRWLRTAPGIEVSPMYGHMNGYPVTIDGLGTDRWRSYWPVDWNLYGDDGLWIRNREPAELLVSLRDELGARVLQLNHPRSFQGIFKQAGFFSSQGLVGDAARFLGTDFNAIEVCNGKRMSSTADVLPDWFALLNQGHRVAAIGNSDSHSRGSEPGYPRNLVPVESQQAVDLAAVFEAVATQRSVLSAGPLLQLEAEGADGATAGPGELLAAGEGGRVELHVRVQAAAFVSVSRARIIVNGEEERVENIGASTDVLRMDTWIDLSLDSDAWVAVIVEGDGGLAPVVWGEPSLAIANPIYVDFDGDGGFSPPGLTP